MTEEKIFDVEYLKNNRMIKELFRSKRVEDMVENLDQEQIIEIAKVAIEISTVPPIKKGLMEDKKFREIKQLVDNSFRRKKLSKDLMEIWEMNKKKAKRKIGYFLRIREKRIFGKKFSQIKNLEKSKDTSKIKKAEQLKIQCLNKAKSIPTHLPNKSSLNDEYSVLMGVYNSILNKEIPISDNELSGEVKYRDMRFNKAYLIYKPEAEYSLYMFEKKYENLPLSLKWATDLPAPTYEYLYNQHKIGKLEKNVINKIYLNNKKNILERKNLILDYPVMKLRERFVDQAFDNFFRRNYAASINLLLPLIEAAIWEYALFLHRTGVKVFKRLQTKNLRNKVFRPEKLILVDLNGNEIDKRQNTVGTLLNETQVSKKFNKFLIRYFCDELYRERNPILHGHDYFYDTRDNALNKIYVLSKICEFVIGEQFKLLYKKFKDKLQSKIH